MSSSKTEPTAATNRTNDLRVKTFHQTVERLSLIPGTLQTLAITLHRANELPDQLKRCSCRLDAARLREEQTAIGYPMTHRIRQAQWESELRQGLFDVREQLRAAIAAATEYVCIAAAGPEAIKTFPFARRVLAELARHRVMPSATESVKVRLAFLESAWQAIDAALASLSEIRFDARQRRESGVRSVEIP
jgi:hypothetical protein